MRINRKLLRGNKLNLGRNKFCKGLSKIGLIIFPIAVSIFIFGTLFADSIQNQELGILNPQIHPILYENWTVEFNTKGIANLTIIALNKTVDLHFLEIKCGNQTLNYSWINNSVFILDYSCNSTGCLILKILSLEDNSLKFQFGNKVQYVLINRIQENSTLEETQNITLLTAINQVIQNTFSIIKGQILNVKAQLIYENFTPIANQEVNFYANSTLIGADLTNETGWAAIDWISNNSGNYTINITYAGNENLSSSFNDTQKIEILPLAEILQEPVNETEENSTNLTQVNDTQKNLMDSTPNIAILSPLNKTYNTTTVELKYTVEGNITWVGYSLNGQDNITINSSLTFESVLGLNNLTIYANDSAGNMGFAKVQFVAELPIFIAKNNLTITETLSQGFAEINKPVKWIKELEIKNNLGESLSKKIKVEIPKEASIVKKGKNKTFSASSVKNNLNNTNEIFNLNTDGIEFDVDLNANEEKTVNIIYETPAPQKLEFSISTGKKVIISSDASMHYRNVTAFSDLPELDYKPKIYRVVNDTRIDVTNNPVYSVVYLDENLNGKYDKLQWIVPQLSNDTYEIDLIILNVQSYPIVGGNWTVMFDTAGTADLTITAVNETTWTNQLYESYDNETQILTEHGWKYLRDLIGEEKVATLNQETGEVEFNRIEKYVAYQYTGSLYKIKGDGFELRVTPNHKLYALEGDSNIFNSLFSPAFVFIFGLATLGAGRRKKDIYQLIKKGESETLEFKSPLSDVNRIVEEFCGFANKKMMKNLSKEWGNKEPYYDLYPIETKIIFESSIKESTYIEEDILKGLNERQIKAVEYLQNKENINRGLYCKINNIKKSVAYEELKFMVNKKIIKQIGKGKATFYILSGRLPDDYRTKKEAKHNQQIISFGKNGIINMDEGKENE
ncbi:MAG: hypothetical protein DRP06_02100 [Candidatus Aenigmatarchaeota archaeon]|nr:MAG: hypothetical protein DRP06_02100 [Candidatus Aenigmarchaeota archaeon]